MGTQWCAVRHQGLGRLECRNEQRRATDTPCFLSDHFGFRDVKMVPSNYHDPPEVDPVRHIVI